MIRRWCELWLVVCVFLSAQSCRTTDPDASESASESDEDDEEGGADGKAASAATSPSDATLPLGTPKSQEIYLKMLAVELASGIKAPKDQLHTSRGLIQCHKDGVLESCFMRVRTIGTNLSASQPLKKEHAAKIWTFIRKQRPDLKTVKTVITNLNCDYIGKKSPPFDTEAVKCTLQHPRSTGEAIFVGPQAEEMAEALRGGIEFANKILVVRGTVACQWMQGSSRSPCMTRAVVRGILQEKISELSSRVSSAVARKLLTTLQDSTKITATSKSTTFEKPQEIMGSATCTVDSRQFESTKERQYLCRVEL